MQTIYLDISNKGVYPCIYAKQNEVGRKFLAVITDNGVPYEIPDNALLSVWYEGETDAGNYSSINENSAFRVEGNKIFVELVAQMLLKPGKGDLCISITHGDGRETNTWNIPYCVEYKPGAGSSVPTEYYTAAIKASQKAQEAVDGYVKIEELESYLLAYEQKKVPVGYVFNWSPVDNGDVDLSTAQKVKDHFGFGTWEQVKDVFLLSCGDSYEIGTSGGEKEHALTIQEMPEHDHFIPNVKITSTTDSGSVYAESFVGGSEQREFYTELQGENKPFNILPPYETVYTWKRIA